MVSTYNLLNPGELEINGTRILLLHGDNDEIYRPQNRADVYYMAKSVGYLEGYDEINKIPGFIIDRPMNIVELGIYKGGSAVFFDKVYHPAKLVCIDLMREPSAALSRYQGEEGGNRVKAYYSTAQDDVPALNAILAKEFDGPLDLVIDDASHWYKPSRVAFETLFPLMRPGGIYVLEDWSWAHNEDAGRADHYWAGQDALTNLVLRFVMVLGVDLGVIRRMGFGPGLMWVQRGDRQLDPMNFSLTTYERPRGREPSLI